MSKRTLKDVKVGEKAIVSGIFTDSVLSRRLLDLGLIPGTEVQCVGVSPCKNPSAYLIRGAVIALRLEDCKNITLSE